MKKIFIALIFMLSGKALYSQMIIRPDASVGYFTAENKGISYDYGIKMLLSANDKQRYGIKLEQLNLRGDNHLSYLATGIFIEQVLFKHFNMGIGTVGYINLHQAGDNPFGVYSHLGFEYPVAKHYTILIAYQSEFIFRHSFTTNNALSIGIGFKI